MTVDRDPAERVVRREVSRTLGGMDLSPEEKDVLERMFLSLANRLLRGPVLEAMDLVRGTDTTAERRRHA